MNIETGNTRDIDIPFEQARLDRLMEEAGLDVLVATSKHNTQYLLGGYRFIFFSAMDAIGHSRYLPMVVYEKGRPENAAYVANRMEAGEHANHPFWTPAFHPACWGTRDAAAIAARHLKAIGRDTARIGIEPGFLPSDAHEELLKSLPGAKLADATGMLERMRAIKTPAELEKLRIAAELITDSMLATIGWAGEGTTKSEIIERLRREETEPRAPVRILPADARDEPQPRRLRAVLAAGRGAVDRFRRQLARLYRRSLPHGRARRAGCRTPGSARRDRGHPAGSLCEDPFRDGRRRQ